ncbi:MAG: glycosyltransferase [Gemmatimonadota bacterium]|nr:glycosyltransferase [Gemmatimonadota bacterium]
MNVLFLTHAFPREVEDPAGSFILRLAVALAGEGVAATVVAPHAPGLPERETLCDVPVRRFRYAPERYETLAYAGTMAEQVRASWAARLALGGLLASAVHSADRQRKEVRAQLLHAHWWFPGGLAAAAVSTVRRLPLVTTLHGSDVRLASSIAGARPVFARVAARSNVVTAVSTWLASQASALAPGAPAPRVAPMPADVMLFSPDGPRAQNRLLFVGRLTPQKGVDLLLRALAELPHDVSLDVVGAGIEAEALQRLAVSLDVAVRVRWHSPVRQSRLADFYRAATALVVPSVEEGLGLVAVEALLCETPVVAFDSGGLRDVVLDGETGVLVRSISATAMATAVNSLLRRPDRGASLGRAGRARALEAFAPEAAARRYLAIYHEAIRHFQDRQS